MAKRDGTMSLSEERPGVVGTVVAVFLVAAAVVTYAVFGIEPAPKVDEHWDVQMEREHEGGSLWGATGTLPHFGDPQYRISISSTASPDARLEVRVYYDRPPEEPAFWAAGGSRAEHVFRVDEGRWAHVNIRPVDFDDGDTWKYVIERGPPVKE